MCLHLSLWYFFAFSNAMGAQMEEYLQRIPLNISKDSAFYSFGYCIGCTFGQECALLCIREDLTTQWVLLVLHAVMCLGFHHLIQRCF